MRRIALGRDAAHWRQLGALSNSPGDEGKGR